MPDSQDPPRVTGWFAYSPDGAVPDWRAEPPPGFTDGAVVTLMAEDEVDVPLWEVGEGLVFGGLEEFIAFGAPEDLAHELAAWAEDRQRHGRRDQSDLAALELLERLRTHFGDRYEFVYRP